MLKTIVSNPKTNSSSNLRLDAFWRVRPLYVLVAFLFGCDSDGDSYSKRNGDCDDRRADIHPGQLELCDDLDNDCDGDVDEGPFDEELCDGLDNDCDGDVDEGPFDEELCDGLDNDCDGDVDEGPFDEELCDGLDNDCDGDVDESTFTFVHDGDGVKTPQSSGTADSPSQIDISEDGTLLICGPVYANITIHQASVKITGSSSDASIDGSSLGTVLHIYDDANVSVDGVSIINGNASSCVISESLPTWLSGGGICCDSSVLDLSSVSIADNSAVTGGGLFSQDCQVTAVDTEFRSNVGVSYGGALAVIDGSLKMSDSYLVSNSTDPTSGKGGAFLLSRTFASAEEQFLFERTTISGNMADAGGGGVIGSNSYVKCVGGGGLGDFVMNQATSSSGALLLLSSTSIIESVGCSWGVGDSNNYSEFGAIDIGSEFLLEDTKDFGDNETFTCSDTVCPQ